MLDLLKKLIPFTPEDKGEDIQYISYNYLKALIDQCELQRDTLMEALIELEPYLPTNGEENPVITFSEVKKIIGRSNLSEKTRYLLYLYEYLKGDPLSKRSEEYTFRIDANGPDALGG